MNELKRELVKVAGDLSDSEARVKEAVGLRMQKKRRRWVPVISVTVVCIVLLLFTQFQQNDTSAMLSHEAYAYYLHYESAMFDEEIENSDKTRALTKLLEQIGTIEYGKSLGLSVSQESIEARFAQQQEFEKQLDAEQLAKYERMMAKVFNEANISEKMYEEIIVPLQTESSLMGELLAQRLHEHYEQLNDVMANHMVKHAAVEYMETHYGEDIIAFRAQYQIEQQHDSPSAVMGVVRLVEGNMFYLIEEAIWSDIQDMTRAEIIAMYSGNEKAAWYPNVDGLEVVPGDIVRVRSGVLGEENGHRVGMNYGGAEILQSASSPNKTINLTGEAAQQFTAHIDNLDLAENTHVSMARLPDYTVTANGITYSIWSKYNQSGMEIVRHDPNGYVSIPKSKAAPLYELLQ